MLDGVVPRDREFAKARAEGRDGIIAKNIVDGGGFGDVYVAFSHTQVKAVTNHGSWSSADPDIRHNPVTWEDIKALGVQLDCYLTRTRDPFFRQAYADRMDPVYFANGAEWYLGDGGFSRMRLRRDGTLTLTDNSIPRTRARWDDPEARKLRKAIEEGMKELYGSEFETNPSVRYNPTRWSKELEDEKSPAGLLPIQGDIPGYEGFVREMSTDKFLELVPPRPQPPAPELIEKVRKGAPIAPPVLFVDWKEDHWQVTGHEGRGRVLATEKLFGPSAIAVDLAFNFKTKCLLMREKLSDKHLKAPIHGEEGSLDQLRRDVKVRRNPMDAHGYRRPGDRVYFEYHCFESPESSDAELWYRSHQRVTVLKLTERGGGDTKRERCANGEPAVYDVQFADGFIGAAVEDELVDSKKQFFRPDPPRVHRNAKHNPDLSPADFRRYVALCKKRWGGLPPSPKYFETLKDVDAWRHGNLQANGSVMSRFDALVKIFGRAKAERAMRELEVRSWEML
jgi:hypothetical protein